MTISLSANNYEIIRAAWTAMDQTYGGVAVGHALQPHDNSSETPRAGRQQPFEVPSGYVVRNVIESKLTGKFTVYVNQSSGIVMLVPTGTNGNKDLVGWATNFLDQGLAQWEFSKDAVLEALDFALSDIPGENKRLIFAGDSRGGALAQFALNEFIKHKNLPNSRYSGTFSTISNQNIAIVTHVSPGARGMLGAGAVPVEQLTGIANHHSATKLVQPSGQVGIEKELVSRVGGAYLDPSWPMHYYTVNAPEYTGLLDKLKFGAPYAHRLAQSGWDYCYQNPGEGFSSFETDGQPRSYLLGESGQSMARLISMLGDPSKMSAFEAYFRTSQLASCAIALSPLELANKILAGDPIEAGQWAALSIVALSNPLAKKVHQLATVYCVGSAVLTLSGLVDWVPGDAGIQETQDFRAQAKAGATPLPGFVNKEAKYTADGGVLVVDASETGDFMTYGFSFNNHFSFGTLNGKPVGSFNKNSWTVDDAGVTTLISESGQPVAIRAFGLPDILPAQGLVQFLLADSEGAVLATVSPDSTRGGFRLNLDGVPRSEIKVYRTGADLCIAADSLSAPLTILGFYSLSGDGVVNQSIGLNLYEDGSYVSSLELARLGLIVYGDTLSPGTEDQLTGLAGYQNTLVGKGGDDILVGANDLVTAPWLGDTFIGGTGSDQISGSRSADTYIFRAGDGHDRVQTQGGTDVLLLQNDAHPETGQTIAVTAAEVRFVKSDLDLVVQLRGGLDTVTVAGWFDPDQPRRLAQVQLGATTWSEKDINSQALSIENWPASATGRTEQFVVEHDDGSFIRRTQYPEGAVKLEHVAAFNEDEAPIGELTQETRWYTSQGALSSVRKNYAKAGFKQLSYAGSAVVGVWKGFADQSSVNVDASKQSGTMYEVTTEVAVRGQVHRTQMWAPLTQPVTGESEVWALPYPLQTQPEDTTFARDVDGALVVLGSSHSPYYLPSSLEAGLTVNGGPLVPETALAALPLFLTRSSGEISVEQVPSSGVVLDPALATFTPTAYHDGQGQVWLEWADATATPVKLSIPEGVVPLIKTSAAEILPASSWAHPSLKVEASGGSSVVELPTEGVSVTLARNLNFDSPNTTLIQRVNDLHVVFSDGTQVLFKDWALRPAALGLRSVLGFSWDSSTVASRIQSYVGDENDNTYTVLTAHGQEVYGGEGNDVLWGGATPGSDLLDGQGGDDRLYGRGGDDILIGGPGIDLLDGGEGNDILYGSEHNDQLWGQAGNDRLFGGDGDDRIYGNEGNDWAEGGEGNDLLAGGAGDDELHGDAGNDDLFGGDGNDVLQGGSGANRLYGDAGNDTLHGGENRNVLSGGAGNDTLYAQGLYDELYGGGDFDTYRLAVHEGASRLLFEDAGGGVVDLGHYLEQGISVSVQKTSADQLVLAMSNSEQLVVNGWAHQTTSLQAGTQSWSWADIANRPNSFQLFGGTST